MAWLPRRAKWACRCSYRTGRWEYFMCFLNAISFFANAFSWVLFFINSEKRKKDLNVNIFLNWIQLGQSRGRQRVTLSLRKPIHEERGQEQRWLKNNERFMMKSRGLGVRSCPGLFAALHLKSIHFLCNPHGCTRTLTHRWTNTSTDIRCRQFTWCLCGKLASWWKGGRGHKMRLWM